MPSDSHMVMEQHLFSRRLHYQHTTTNTCTAPLCVTMTIPASLAPASQIQTFKHPEFHLKPLLPDHNDPKGYNTPFYSFSCKDVLSAKRFIDHLAHKHVPHCLWAEPVTPCYPRKRGLRRVPLDPWSEMVSVYILPEILTPCNATIVLMFPYGNARAGNIFWIFPKTMSRGAEPNAPSRLIDAVFIKNCLHGYRPRGTDGDCLFRNGEEIRIEMPLYALIHTGLVSLHMAGMMYTRRTKWIGDVPAPVRIETRRVASPTYEPPGSFEASDLEKEARELQFSSKTLDVPNERKKRESAPSPPTLIPQQAPIVSPRSEQLEGVRQSQIKEKKEQLSIAQAEIEDRQYQLGATDVVIDDCNALVDSESDEFPAKLVNPWIPARLASGTALKGKLRMAQFEEAPVKAVTPQKAPTLIDISPVSFGPSDVDTAMLEDEEWNSEDTDPDDSGSDEDMDLESYQEQQLTKLSPLVSECRKFTAILERQLATFSPQALKENRKQCQAIQDSYQLYEAANAAHRKTLELRKEGERDKVVKMDALLEIRSLPSRSKKPVPQYKSSYERAVYIAKRQQTLPYWAKEGDECAKNIQKWQAMITQGRAADVFLQKEAMEAMALTLANRRAAMTLDEAVALEEAVEAEDEDEIHQRLDLIGYGKAALEFLEQGEEALVPKDFVVKTNAEVRAAAPPSPEQQQQLPTPEMQLLSSPSPTFAAKDEGKTPVSAGYEHLTPQTMRLGSPPVTPEMVAVLPATDEEMKDI